MNFSSSRTQCKNFDSSDLQNDITLIIQGYKMKFLKRKGKKTTDSSNRDGRKYYPTC